MKKLTSDESQFLHDRAIDSGCLTVGTKENYCIKKNIEFIIFLIF